MPGTRCAVGVCNNIYAKTYKFPEEAFVAYHCFPKDKLIRRIWIQRCRRKDKINPNKSYICSSHFTASDYDPDLKGILKRGAIPSRNLLANDKRIVRFDYNNTGRSKRLFKRNNEKIVQTALENVTCCKEEGVLKNDPEKMYTLEHNCLNFENDVPSAWVKVELDCTRDDCLTDENEVVDEQIKVEMDSTQYDCFIEGNKILNQRIKIEPEST